MLITSIFKYMCGHANKLKYWYEMNEKQKKVTGLLGLQKYLVNFILFFTLQLVIGEPHQTTTLKHIQHEHNVKIMTNGWGCVLQSYFLLQKVPQIIISHYDINLNMSMKQNTSCCKVSRLELAKYCTVLIPVKCPVLIHYAWCCLD